MRGARSRVRSRKAAVIALVMANAVVLATLCVAAAPAWGDPPPKPVPSLTTTPPPVPSTQSPATNSSPAGTTSESPGLIQKQIIAPAVKLSRDQGAPGMTFSATVTGSAPCRLGPVKLQWDSDTPVDVDKVTATASFTVPADAKTGQHKVSGTCSEKVFASSAFTVVEKPSLTIDPDKGPPGSQLQATGTGFACGDDADTVDIALDSDVRGHGSSGRFSEQISVPADASGGDHTVVASCHNHPDITGRQTFTVTSTVTTTTGSGSSQTSVVPMTGSAEVTPVPATPVPTTTTASTKDVDDTSDLASYWWVLVLIAVAVALLGSVHHMLKPPPVHAVLRVAGPPLVTVQETPAPGESTHALRLETHSGARTLTVEEVNDGHIPAE